MVRPPKYPLIPVYPVFATLLWFRCSGSRFHTLFWNSSFSVDPPKIKIFPSLKNEQAWWIEKWISVDVHILSHILTTGTKEPSSFYPPMRNILLLKTQAVAYLRGSSNEPKSFHSISVLFHNSSMLSQS